MIYLGYYPFLYKKLIEEIKNIRKLDKTSKFSFIIFSNTIRRALKEYITDELNILYNSEFFTKVDIAKNILKENPINDLEKRILLKIILEKNNNYIKGLEDCYSDIFQSLKEEKIQDNNIPDEINKIFKEYNSILKELNLKDREDLIKEASNFNFKSYYIFIFGFQSLSLIDRELFKVIIENNDINKLKIFLPLDVESNIYKNNKYLSSYLEFFKSFGIKEIYQNYIDDNIKISRLINSKKIIEESINSQNLKFIKVKGKKQEIDYLAKYIIYLRENKNISWNKIGIIISDIEAYIDYIKKIFSDYHIPYYISHENRYIDDINFKKIFSLLNLKLKNFSKNDLLNSLSNEILNNIDNINIDELEKLLIEKSFENDFEKLKKFLNDKNLLDILEYLNNINDNDELTYFLNKIEEFVNKYFRESYYKNKIVDIINTIKSSKLFFNYKNHLSFKDFNNIFLKYLEEENKDNRKRGDIVEIRTPAIALGMKFEHLFFIDMNEEKFPIIKDDNYILNKYDKLKELISKKEVVYSQQLITFLNLFNSSENNYIFYKEIDDNGNELSSSVITEELLMYQFGKDYNKNYLSISKDILDKKTLKEFKVENSKSIMINDFKKLIEMNASIESPNLSVYEGFFENKSLLYQNKKLSPSQLQAYIECPYKFFISYLVKPSIFKINNLEKIPYDKEGEIIHKILEYIYSKYEFFTDNQSLIDKTVNEKFEEYFQPILNELNETSIIFEKIRISQLKYSLISFIKNDISRIKKENYKISNLEYYCFTKIKDYEITGRIDRIEVKDNIYNIYDYKISSHKELHKEIKKGDFIQLYLYKKSLEEENKNIGEVGILFIKESESKIREKISPNEIDIIQEKIDVEIDLINKNFLSPYTENDKCKYCNYSLICGKEHRKEELKNKFLKNEYGKVFIQKIKGKKHEIEES